MEDVSFLVLLYVDLNNGYNTSTKDIEMQSYFEKKYSKAILFIDDDWKYHGNVYGLGYSFFMLIIKMPRSIETTMLANSTKQLIF